jgi:ABC-type cobalamin/Fe3+-siderophores transport system ATPase subunit
MSEEKEIVVKSEDLSVIFDESKARVDYGSLEISKGDFVLIRGKNGSGKSTLLKLFKPEQCTYFQYMGKLFYQEGENADKNLFDYTDRERSALNRKIVEIGQEETFETGASAYDVIANPARRAVKYSKTLSKQEKKEKLEQIDRRINEWFETYIERSFFGTAGKKRNYLIFKYKAANKWSGGQKKMVHLLAGILKALLIEDVCLLLMDEPLNNLDGYNKSVLNDMIADLRQKRSVAILMVTHCHIFDGVNKTLTICEIDGAHRASLETVSFAPHRDYLESFK